MIQAKRPLRLPEGMKTKHHPAPALKINRNNRADMFWGKYPELGMHAIRYPYLCYVVEGEIDMRLAIPSQKGATRGIANRYEILTLLANTALLIPPGVFYPDGSQPHWERPSPSIDARIFWTHILPAGVFCHTSVTRHQHHAFENLAFFVPGQHFTTLREIIEEELQLPDKESSMVARNALLTFFTRILRGLKTGTHANIAMNTPTSSESSVKSDDTNIIQRACEFIRKHNNVPFTVTDVAAYAYVSPSHLMRLFRTELHTTVMDYTLEQRLNVAEAWLKNSEMPIQQIAKELGYSQAPQFHRAFKKIHGISPSEFRQRYR